MKRKMVVESLSADVQRSRPTPFHFIMTNNRLVVRLSNDKYHELIQLFQNNMPKWFSGWSETIRSFDSITVSADDYHKVSQ